MQLAAKEGRPVNPNYIFREQWTGATLDRPLLNQLRDLIRRRAVDVIYVYSPDRLARDPLHLLTVIEECSIAGVELRFVRDGAPDTP